MATGAGAAGGTLHPGGPRCEHPDAPGLGKWKDTEGGQGWRGGRAFQQPAGGQNGLTRKAGRAPRGAERVAILMSNRPESLGDWGSSSRRPTQVR